MCCIRLPGDYITGDSLLEPTTFDEVGELLTVAAHLHTDGRGHYWLEVVQVSKVPHPEDHPIPLQRGLYKIKADKNWPGAAMVGVCDDL